MKRSAKDPVEGSDIEYEELFGSWGIQDLDARDIEMSYGVILLEHVFVFLAI